jgi:hypothetical protein
MPTGKFIVPPFAFQQQNKKTRFRRTENGAMRKIFCLLSGTRPSRRDPWLCVPGLPRVCLYQKLVLSDKYRYFRNGSPARLDKRGNILGLLLMED